MIFQDKISDQPFNQWIRTKENYRILLISLLLILLSFLYLKILYPYPNFMPPDSISYVDAASKNNFINVWSIGYSKSLRLVSCFSHSHIVLVSLQYFLLELSLLYCLFTFRYLLSLRKGIFLILLIVCTLNPLIPHISNFVSSDCLFLTLSLTWFTQLLWIIYNPSNRLLIFHVLILLFAFIVRYNALFYPVISIVVIIFSSINTKSKWLSITIVVFLLMSYIGRTQYEYYKETKTIQFAAFAGWQIAANALYGYAHAQQIPLNAIPVKYKGLHEIVNNHMDSLNKLSIRPDVEIGLYYQWHNKSPLRMFMEKKAKKDLSITLFKKWAEVAPLYKSYGLYLIFKRPMCYLMYFVWPNLKRYYAPPPFFMGYYNMGNEKTDLKISAWFKWNNNKLYTKLNSKTIRIASAFTIIVPIINLIFILTLGGFIFLGGFSQCNRITKNIIKCSYCIWTFNLLFSVFSAPIELRYELFPIIICSTWSIIFLDYIIGMIRISNQKPLKSIIPN